jgi:hypothetical protein
MKKILVFLLTILICLPLVGQTNKYLSGHQIPIADTAQNFGASNARWDTSFSKIFNGRDGNFSRRVTADSGYFSDDVVAGDTVKGSIIVAPKMVVDSAHFTDDVQIDDTLKVGTGSGIAKMTDGVVSPTDTIGGNRITGNISNADTIDVDSVHVKGGQSVTGVFEEEYKIGKQDSLFYWQEKSFVNDDDSISLPAGVCGWGEAMLGDNAEWALFRFTSAAAVTPVSNSANAVNTDTDTKFCIYPTLDATAVVSIRNRSGAAAKVAVHVHYYTP